MDLVLTILKIFSSQAYKQSRVSIMMVTGSEEGGKVTAHWPPCCPQLDLSLTHSLQIKVRWGNQFSSIYQSPSHYMNIHCYFIIGFLENYLDYKGGLHLKKCKIFYIWGGGQEWSLLHFSKTCLKCVSSHSELYI